MNRKKRNFDSREHFLDLWPVQGLYGRMKTKKIKSENLELLAPAGSLQAFFAAIECGADAVFCGLKTFSARAGAKNFTLEELNRLVGYGHRLHKKIYVAMNTLVKESELAELIEVLHELERLSIDGLIVQDLGLYRLVRKYFPGIPLHASTQMVIHNLAGVQMLESMGFERVVLAREMSLSEIGYISKRTNIEIEHFIHGALCYSMSGHCLFSSYIDGRSGNRGRCIQPCRRRYHHDDATGFYFSTSDFSAIELIPELAKAGVMSLKIEGRMKSPEYVAAVVSAYRTVIDAKPGRAKEAIKRAKEQLETAMGRKSTPGFLTGSKGVGIVLPELKGGIGKIIAKVERIKGNSIQFQTSARIHIGDRLRVQPGNDRAGQGFTVRTLFLGNRACKVATKGSVVSIPLPVKVKGRKPGVGDLVFLLASGQTVTKSEEACLRLLKTAPSPGRDVHLFVQADEGKSTFTVCSLVNDKEELLIPYPVEMIAAKKSPLTRETIEKVFSHTGYPELVLNELKTNDLPRVVIKPSRLKEIRRDFYAKLQELSVKSQDREKKLRLATVKSEVCTHRPFKEIKPKKQLYIVTDQQDDLQAVLENPDILFVFSLTGELLEEAITLKLMAEGAGKRFFWDLPSIIFDESWGDWQKLVRRAVDAGFPGFRLNNLAHFEFFKSVTDMNLITGSWIYALNSQTMKGLEELGAQRFCLSIDDDGHNYSLLLEGNRLDRLLITVFSQVELFTSRIPPSVTQESFSLQNDKGDQFDVKVNNGLTITTAQKSFSLIGKLAELQNMGCCNFVIDLRGTGLLTGAGQEVVAAYYDDAHLPGTIVLNYSRGLR